MNSISKGYRYSVTVYILIYKLILLIIVTDYILL